MNRVEALRVMKHIPPMETTYFGPAQVSGTVQFLKDDRR